MQIEKLAEGIKKKFEQGRIVFWHDPERSFVDDLDALGDTLKTTLPDVAIVNLAGVSVLNTKKRIELDEPEQTFLLYSPEAVPPVTKDWLFDIRKYSPEFYADQSSILINELGLTKMSLRAHISQRKDFFASKKRISDLQKRIVGDENELELDLHMLSVITKADDSRLESILYSLFEHYANVVIKPELQDDSSGDDNEDDDDTSAKHHLPLVKQLKRFDLQQTLFEQLEKHYGYQSDQPSIREFVLRLFCTELYTQINAPEQQLNWLKHNVLSTPAGRATANTLMSGWRDSKKHSESYETVADEIQHKLELSRQLEQYSPEQLIECETFEQIEQAIIRGLVQSLLTESQSIERSEFEDMLSRRLVSHWPNSRKEYADIYQALRYGELLLHLRRTHESGFSFDSAKAMYSAYQNDLYQFDQAYRLFNEFAHGVQSKGADILRRLDDEVERIYSNWYLIESSMAWDRLLEKENRLSDWQLPGVTNQYQFYEKQVKARLQGTQIKRMFVIVSDALRYEIAHELSDRINNEKRFNAKLDSQLGVLPSYTQLGMAALLPTKVPTRTSGSGLDYETKAGSAVVTVDGQSTQGLENRNKVLQRVNGMAVSYKELMSWTNQQGRDAVKDAEVVYIYHDTIDAIGDKAATEERTFQACRDAIGELKDMVGKVINRLNASRVVVTADHGFLFRQQEMLAQDKTPLAISKPDGAREAKKRYIVGENLPTPDGCWKGNVKDTAGGDSASQFLLPKGVQRFHFVGGAKFVHGGATLQEICVPIVEVRELDKKQAVKHQKQPVGVILMGSQGLKLVNNIDSVNFMQTDAVGDKHIARRLNIFVRDDAGDVVSSVETVSFDSSAKTVDERTKSVMIKLKGASFDRTKLYSLVLQNDDDAKTEYSSYPVRIDLAFQDDFF